MQEARILHIEDSEDVRNTVELVLCVRGVHRVVAHAETVFEAGKKLEAIKEGKLNANVVFLDGNLRSGEGMNHPRVVLSHMKILELKLPVIGLSGDGLSVKGVEVGKDIVADLIKDEIKTNTLDRLLDSLPEPAVE